MHIYKRFFCTNKSYLDKTASKLITVGFSLFFKTMKWTKTELHLKDVEDQAKQF